MRKIRDHAQTRRAAPALFALACLFCACATAAAGQARGWVWQNPLPQGNAINSVRFAADKRHGWAVGADGVILRSDDGGFGWESQTSPATTTLYGLYVKDKRTAVAVGARGVVVTTEDGGDRWLLRRTNVRDHLSAVAFAGDGLRHGWAVGTYGSVVATDDGGRTWRAQTSHVRAHLYAVAFSD